MTETTSSLSRNNYTHMYYTTIKSTIHVLLRWIVHCIMQFHSQIKNASLLTFPQTKMKLYKLTNPISQRF